MTTISAVFDENFSWWACAAELAALAQAITDGDDAVKDLISGYEFTGKLKNEGILNSLKSEMGFLQRKALINDVRGEIVNLVDMFSW